MSGETTAYLRTAVDSFFAKAFTQLAALPDDAVHWALIGGLAVSARLAVAHRATTDVDAVAEHPDELIEMLRTQGGVKTRGRVMLHGVPIEPLPVPGRGAGQLPAAREWAYRGAERMQVVVTDATGVALAEARLRVATAPGLILLKLESAVHAEDRDAKKRATDIYDVLRLFSTGAASFTAAAAGAPRRLKADAAQCVRERLIQNQAKTISYLSDVQRDEFSPTDMRAYGEALVTALTR